MHSVWIRMQSLTHCTSLLQSIMQSSKSFSHRSMQTFRKSGTLKIGSVTTELIFYTLRSWIGKTYGHSRKGSGRIYRAKGLSSSLQTTRACKTINIDIILSKNTSNAGELSWQYLGANRLKFSHASKSLFVKSWVRSRCCVRIGIFFEKMLQNAKTLQRTGPDSSPD